MTARGFGVAAAAPAEVFSPLATEAEKAGYQTFWVNDTPGSDGFQRLSLAAASTSTIRLGVGVVAVDRRNATDILETVSQYSLPEDRLIVGIGAGATRVGSLDLVTQTIEALRASTPARIAVGALGPNMVSLSARLADAVLLNWLTAEHAERSKNWMREAHPATQTEVIGYVRVAGVGAEDQTKVEADRYAAIPQYGRHFDEMGVSAFETCATGSSDQVRAKLSEFDAVLDETVIRAVAAQELLSDYLEILHKGRPESA